MEKYDKHSNCPIWLAGMLDNRLRRLFEMQHKRLLKIFFFKNAYSEQY
jgi:hypothetical protein